ncbi:MAG: DUF1097 domain-containing protein [Clostridium sp.]|uniref:DUF1097 domain-containing protein n=1 Tax=Desulfitibacter alkalitolerans TaxID=264641 RepID=UPI000685A739|nr:DUF1097 domain-containing protein [Desulfitibacter alkalitolerans]MBS4007358.1 DUF1097 domain-containing protein [Clostridium sp.]
MPYLSLAIVIGVLAGIWTFVSGTFNILTWPAFVGWALFFFTGGNAEAIKKSVPPALSGIILGYLCVVLWGQIGGGLVMLAVLVAVIAFIMTYMINVPAFATAPAAFAACASYFGGGDPIAVGIPLFIGIGLGYLSVIVPDFFPPKVSGAQKENI